MDPLDENDLTEQLQDWQKAPFEYHGIGRLFRVNYALYSASRDPSRPYDVNFSPGVHNGPFTIRIHGTVVDRVGCMPRLSDFGNWNGNIERCPGAIQCFTIDGSNGPEGVWADTIQGLNNIRLAASRYIQSMALKEKRKKNPRKTGLMVDTFELQPLDREDGEVHFQRRVFTRVSASSHGESFTDLFCVGW